MFQAKYSQNLGFWQNGSSSILDLKKLNVHYYGDLFRFSPFEGTIKSYN